MFEVVRLDTRRGPLVVTATERSDGDLHPRRVPARELQRRQRSLTGEPWTMLDQVHGVDVVTVDPGPTRWAPTVGTGDVLVAAGPSRPIAVWTADCVPVVLVDGTATTVAGVHAGWRGLAAGALDVAVDAVESHGSHVAAAVLGPRIGPCCYEFGDDELRMVADGIGAQRRSLTASTIDGRPALDLTAAVTAVLVRRGIDDVVVVDGCTACDDRWFSHRRGDAQRHATVAWFAGGGPS